MRNVTIDNTNKTAIELFPPLCNGTGWDRDESIYAAYAVQNTYAYCSGTLNAHATFTFTGVAVYYSCPLFEAQDSMMLKLDDRPIDTISLTSPSGSPVMSQVIWSVVDLPNKQHTVEMLPGQFNGDIGFVSIDAFIVTEDDTPTSSSGAYPSATGPPNRSKSSSKKSKSIGIGVGVGIGSLVLFGLLAMFFFFRKKRRSQAGVVKPSLTDSPVAQTFMTPTTTGTTQPFISPAPTGTPYSATPYDPNAGYNQPAFNMPDPAMAYYSQPPRQSVVYSGVPSQPTSPSPMTMTSSPMTTATNPNAPIYV
jgi:hypothetical protein